MAIIAAIAVSPFAAAFVSQGSSNIVFAIVFFGVFAACYLLRLADVLGVEERYYAVFC